MKHNLTNNRKFKLISITWSFKGTNCMHRLESLLYQRTLNTRGQNNTSELMTAALRRVWIKQVHKMDEWIRTAANLNSILIKTTKNYLRYLSNNALHHKSGTDMTGRGVPHVSTSVYACVCSITLVFVLHT